METKKRLIEANELLAEAVKVQALEPDKAVAKIIMLITEAETVDAVEIVRCEHCENWRPKYQWCKAWDGARRKDNYCNFGIRREDNGSD